MGRKQSEEIRNYFIEKEKKNECKLCKKQFSGNNITNLKRHLSQNHNDVKINNEGEEHLNLAKKRKIVIETNAEIIKKSCVQIIAEGHPLQILDSRGFRAIMDPIYESLKMNIINRHNIMEYITNIFETDKQKLKRDICKQMISLKIDAATRLNRSMLGINVQFVKNEKIIIKTLAMTEMTVSHTSQNLKEEILKSLENYNIKLEQVYSITSDNGRNMIKAVHLLNDNEENENSLDPWPLIENITLGSVVSIRCAAHTLQLAIHDTIKSEALSTLIEKARKAIKLMRTPTFK